MPSKGLSNRIIIIKILRDCFKSQSQLNTIYAQYFENHDLSEQDKRFIVNVSRGTIRMLKRIDVELQHYSKRNINKFELLYLSILRSAVYQIKHMSNTPAYATVSTSVDIAKRYFPKYTGFTNAVLRNVSKNEFSFEKPNIKSSVKEMSIYYSHPEWLVDRWRKEFGYNLTVKLLESNNSVQKVWFRYNKNKIELSAIEESMLKVDQSIERNEYLDNFFTVSKPSSLLNDNIFSKGYISVQSPTNGIIVDLLSPKEDDVILDICAAPGGKTINISEKMNNLGQIISYDVNSERINLIQRNLDKNRINNVKVVKSDVSIAKLANCSKMIVDVPCSGTGTMSKNADLRWNKSEDNIQELCHLQEKILNNCSRYLKNKGVLVYSTCSIEKEENWMVVDKFLSRNTNYYIEDASKYVGNQFVDSKGAVNINPAIHSMDGGFAVRLVRHDN